MRTRASPSTCGESVIVSWPASTWDCKISAVMEAEIDSMEPGIIASLMNTIGSRLVSARSSVDDSTDRITRPKTSRMYSGPCPDACDIAFRYVRSVASASTVPSSSSRLPTQRYSVARPTPRRSASSDMSSGSSARYMLAAVSIARRRSRSVGIGTFSPVVRYCTISAVEKW
uniref:Uncharacterized protein n=1 Tax=Rhodococcus erythropolis TaxID=1833 RepID=Q5DQU2_RHOER|nr:unknown [Rhodococcus erythropolis]